MIFLRNRFENLGASTVSSLDDDRNLLMEKHAAYEAGYSDVIRLHDLVGVVVPERPF